MAVLMYCTVAVETNRCFFLHLGVACGIHPFALQCYFRHMCEAQRGLTAQTNNGNGIL